MPKLQKAPGGKTKPRPTTVKKNEKERPLTAEEIAFINNTKIPPDVAGMDAGSLYSMLLPLITKLIELMESYYTRDTFQSSFGICPNTNKMWMRDKGLPYIQLGNIILYKKSDVDSFLMKYRRVKGKPE